ncbi:Thioesterase super member 6 [Aspergillus hancockii]|nr:Thioesterase super member 6 [Aspergillus hancockii]
MEAISSLVSSLWESVGFWKAAAIFFALLNLKTLPIVWHIRVYRYFFKHGYLITPAVEQPARPSTEILNPVSIFSRAPIMELDFNMHKSNSTYFSDLDVSRTALMSSIVVKGAALLEKRLSSQGKNGFLGFILGSVYTNFKREIPAYMKYEVKSHVASFDQKWIYIITYFLKPGKALSTKKDQDHVEVQKKRLLAVSISKYVLKKGRYTVPPKDAFEAAGYTPFLETSDANGHSTGAENGHTNGTAVHRKDASDSNSDEWQRLKAEIDRGLTIVEPFNEQEDKLMEDYVHKMSLPHFA